MVKVQGVWRVIALLIAALSAASMLYVGLYQSRFIGHLICPITGYGCQAVADAPFAHPFGIPDGGTLRDLLIGAPVFWISDSAYLWIGAAASLVVWIAGARVERAAALIWLDALGLAAYAVIGAAKALALQVDPVVATAMGVLTACFGGVIRDVLAGQPSVLLKREISVSAALLAAAAFVALTMLR